ncbi:MAG: SagB/ThcOx family dehydrogenase [Gemmatimonadaceae bacterium]
MTSPVQRDGFDLAELYHLNSSNVRSKSGDLMPEYDRRPARFVRVIGAKGLALPKGHFRIRQPLGVALRNRRSVRDFVLRELPIGRLSQLLFLSHGVRGLRTIDDEVVFDRCAPSAGGLYPVELYVATQMVKGVPDGIYHYDARFHKLEQLKQGLFHDELAALTIGQEMIRSANLVIIMTAVFRRTTWKYGLRGYRYAWLDAGHIAQNMYLAAGGLDLGAVTIGGFFDAEVSQLLGLQSDESPIYLACIGRPRRGA